MRSILVKFVIVFLCIIVVFPFIRYTPPSEKIDVENGILDARSINLSKTMIPLKGEWEFAWQKLNTPSQFHNRGSNLIQVPAKWADGHYTGPETVSNEGYGTYHLRMIVSEHDKTKPLSLYLPPIASAYKLWINNELAASNGVVGVNKESMKPKSYAKVITFQANTTEIELTLQVSNFVQRKGGMWKNIQFGSEALIHQAREKTIIRDVFLVSILFLIGCSQLILYWFNRRNKLSLFLGCFCLLMILRTLLLGDMLLIYWFPAIPWELSVKVEYLSAYIGLMLLFIFINYLYPEESNQLFVKIFSGICILFSLTTILPAIYFTSWIFIFYICFIPASLYIVYVLIRATIHNRVGAFTNCVIVSIMVISILNDMFYYSFLISSELTPIGAFIGLFTQSVILARKSSQAFTNVESLSAELLRMNQSLEEHITQRTLELEEMNGELQQTNQKLQTVEQTRRQFFSTIAHELGTPMQSIQGYVQLLQDGLPPEEQEKYLQIVYEKTKLLNRLSSDLLELAKMEENQITFYFEETDFNEVKSYFFQRFKLEIERSGLQCKQIQINDVPAGHQLLVNIDFIRIEQAFSNLLQNAIRHTPPGGTITLQGEVYSHTPQSGEEQWGIRISVCDTGAGIEPELLPHIFKRFIKGTRSSSKTGTGLGLAICKQIIKHHGGTISASSELGKGSKFTITLPAIVRKEESIHE